MRNLTSVKNAVKATLSQHFDHLRILDVKIAEDVDADGDEFLRIDVIFEGESKDLDARKLSEIVRHLRPRLDKIHESALPLLSFISKADLDRSRRASR